MDESLAYFKKWEENVQKGTFNPTNWQRKKVQLNHPDRRWLSSYAVEPVLDVACGSAVDSTLFNQHIGVDVTPSFIKSARQHGARNLIIGDARSLPIRKKAVQTSYCKDLLLHMSFNDSLKVIRELLRVGRKTYVAWGFGYDKGNLKTYTPIDKPNHSIVMRSGFWHNRFSRKTLNLHFIIGSVIKGTSITEVKRK